MITPWIMAGLEDLVFSWMVLQSSRESWICWAKVFFIFPLVKLVNPHQSTISIHGGNHDNHGESFGNLGSNDLSHLLWWPPPGRSPRICGYWHRAKYVWRLLLRLDQAPSDEHPFGIFRLCLSAGQPGESFSRWTWWLLLKIRHNHV